MMKYIVNTIAFISAFALTAFGGWNTELFDGESKRWGHGYERAQQCYSAVVERAKIAYGESWTNKDITPRRWGSSWTLEEAKDCMTSYGFMSDWSYPGGTYSSFWVNPSNLNGYSYVDFLNSNSWYDSGEYDCTNGFSFHEAELLDNADASTDWFDVDPHWGTVVNTNGWGSTDDIVNLLTNTFDIWNSSLDPGTYGSIKITSKRWNEYGTSPNSYAEAIVNAEANLVSAVNENYMFLENEASLTKPGGTYIASRSVAGLKIEFWPSDIHSKVKVYAAAEIYSAHGMVSWTTSYEWHHVKDVNVGGGNCVVEIGPQEHSDAVDWPSSAGTEGWTIWYDYYPGALAIVRELKVTDGFEYVEE